jgi:hypothetical protein
MKSETSGKVVCCLSVRWRAAPCGKAARYRSVSWAGVRAQPEVVSENYHCTAADHLRGWQINVKGTHLVLSADKVFRFLGEGILEMTGGGGHAISIARSGLERRQATDR